MSSIRRRSLIPLPRLALPLLLVAAACSSNEPEIQCRLPYPDPPAGEAEVDAEYEFPEMNGEGDAPALQSARRQGYEEARRDIAAGTPRLRFGGLPKMNLGWLDPATGIVRQNTGCVIYAELMAATGAYNAEIRRALAAGELEARTFAHKVTDAETLSGLFARSDAPLLGLDADPVEAPGGRFVVELALRGDTPYVWVVDRETEERSRQPLMFVGGDCRLLFDHGGTTLYVRDEGYGTTMTFDLPTGTFLQGFPDEG